MMKYYKAPWSTSLIIMSAFGAVVCVGSAVGVAYSGRLWIALLPLAVLCGGILFTVRGYTVSPDVILVHRLFWMTRLPLAALKSAQFQPNAMRRSLRTFGNGGLFSFTGFFRNSSLGTYRAFVTDPHRTVVLRFPARTVVLSPSAPEDFVHDIAAAAHANA
jgi:hypothetical protein